jgi:outer membrane protein
MILLLLLTLSGTAGAAPRPITLHEAYTLALAQSETISQNKEAVLEALARVDEIKSAILPHLSLFAQDTFQESPGSPIKSINRTEIPQAQITLQQPIFAGLREFLAFKQSKRLAESAGLTQKRAESLLYQDVAQAYLNLLQVQREIDIRGKMVEETEKRELQLARWVSIGRSRESELLSAKTRLAQEKAQIEIVRGQEEVAQEVLRFLTGLDAEFLAQDVAPPVPGPLEQRLIQAKARDDIEARRKELEASSLGSSIARRERWPVIGLTANYYLKRVGFSENVHYDAILGLSLPLFDGGGISARTKAAEARERSSREGLSLALRSAERELRSAYRSLESSISAVSALEKSADLADQNVKAQEEDYRRSLVTNLDVLDSLNALESARLQLNAARAQAALADAELEVASGGPERKENR